MPPTEGRGRRDQVVPKATSSPERRPLRVQLMPVGAGCPGGHVPRPRPPGPAASSSRLPGSDRGRRQGCLAPSPAPQVAAQAPSPSLRSQENGLLALLRYLCLEGPPSQEGEGQRLGGAPWVGEETTTHRGNQRLQNHVVPLTLQTFSLDSRPQLPSIG